MTSKQHKQWASKRMDRPEKAAQVSRGSELIYKLLERAK